MTFSGRQFGLASLTLFEFSNFLQENYPKYDKYFFVDKKTIWYTKGIEGITSSIDETLLYLKHIITGYENVIFIGASMGGYAAILYGSLLKVDYIIAFRPQTLIKKYLDEKDNNTYHDLKLIINRTSKYYIYGDSAIKDYKNIHSFHHCKRLNIYPNVVVYGYDHFDIKKYKNNKYLIRDFHDILKKLNI